MKKLLTMSLITLLAASSAFANVRIDETQYDPAANGISDGTMTFSLAIQNTFVYKLLNDKADADAGVAGVQEAQDSYIDLGSISGGVPVAAASNNCADLLGLTPVASLGVTAGVEAETGLSVTGEAAKCHVASSAGAVDLRMAIPLESVLSKTGAGTLDIAYSTEQVVGEEFQVFSLCESTIGALDLSTGSPACAIPKAPQLAVGHDDGQQMHVVLEARIAGSGAKAFYTAKVLVDISDTP